MNISVWDTVYIRAKIDMILIKLCPKDFRAQGNELMPRLCLCFKSSQSHCREAKKNCEQFSFEIFRKKIAISAAK